MSIAGVVTVLVVVVAVVAVRELLSRRSGRVRMSSDRGVDGWALTGVEPGPGDRVLLLQLSSPICAPCRTTAGLLGDLAAGDPGVKHIVVDVGERVDVARALGVLSTPTTVAFGRDGAEILRVSGVPSIEELRGALAG